MSLKVLGKGSACPASSGKLRIYCMRFCPFCERVKLVAAHKNIDHEIVNINLSDKPDWFLEKNPDGKVPLIETTDGKLVPDSVKGAEYLDEMFPGEKLMPEDPQEKSRVESLTDGFWKGFGPCYKIVFESKGAEQAMLDMLEPFLEGLDFFEKELGEGLYFGGEKPNMVDFILWPLFERTDMALELTKTEFPADRFPKLNAYMACMPELPAVKQIMLPTSIHVGYAKTIWNDKPDYDYGL